MILLSKNIVSTVISMPICCLCNSPWYSSGSYRCRLSQLNLFTPYRQFNPTVCYSYRLHHIVGIIPRTESQPLFEGAHFGFVINFSSVFYCYIIVLMRYMYRDGRCSPYSIFLFRILNLKASTVFYPLRVILHVNVMRNESAQIPGCC